MKLIKRTHTPQPGVLVRCTAREFARLSARRLWSWLNTRDGRQLDVIEIEMHIVVTGGRQIENPSASADDETEEWIEMQVSLDHLTKRERDDLGFNEPHIACFVEPPEYRSVEYDVEAARLLGAIGLTFPGHATAVAAALRAAEQRGRLEFGRDLVRQAKSSKEQGALRFARALIQKTGEEERRLIHDLLFDGICCSCFEDDPTGCCPCENDE